MANTTNSKPTVIGLPKISFTPEVADFAFVDIRKLKRIDQIVCKPTKYGREIFKRFLRNRWAVVFSVLLIIILLTAVIVAIRVATNTTYDPNNPIVSGLSADATRYLPPRPFAGMEPSVTSVGTLAQKDQAMSLGIIDGTPTITDEFLWVWNEKPYNVPALNDTISILGTTNSGQDVWTRLWVSTGISFGIAFAVSICATIIGVIYGAISGIFAGRAADTIMMRIVEIISGVPTIIWLIVLGIVFKQIAAGGQGIDSAQLNNPLLIVTLICLLWISPAVSTRTYILKNKDADYVQATRTLGGKYMRIVFVHMIPVIAGRLAVIFVNMIPTVIFYEASLYFLNLKDISELGLGLLLNFTWQTSNPAEIYAPIVVFAALTISAQIVANALNDAIDPRVVGRG